MVLSKIFFAGQRVQVCKYLCNSIPELLNVLRIQFNIYILSGNVNRSQARVYMVAPIGLESQSYPTNDKLPDLVIETDVSSQG